MIDIETPSVRILPESVSERMPAGSRDAFELEVVSTNGFSVRGAVFSDQPGISFETRTFTGRRIHIRVLLDTVGLVPGEHLQGDICLVTNAGEFRVHCDILCTEMNEASGSEPAGEISAPEEPGESAATRQTVDHTEGPLVYGAPRGYIRTPADAGSDTDRMTDEQRKLLCTVFPKDRPLFEAVVTGLIRAKDESPAAFAFYREAIRDRKSTRLNSSHAT